MAVEEWAEFIPSVSPNVEHHLMQILAKEVAVYTSNLQGVKCHLCPFRTFDRFSRLKNHCKHHCIKNKFMADSRSPQRWVIRALYDYHQSNCPILNVGTDDLNLLHQSAVMIARWNSICSEITLTLLKSQN